MQTVMDTYPPNEYPKLYSSSLENYKKFQNKYSVINTVIFMIGLSTLTAFVLWDYLTDREISQMIPWAYFMLQMIPMVWLEISEFKSFKAMRLANTSTKKTATIRPRKLLDFISLKLIGFALAMLLIAFALVFYRYGYSKNALENVGVILACNLFFIGIIYWNIYGTKMDPYQADDDRLKILKMTVTSMTYISIAVSIFLSVQMLVNMFQLDFLEKSIMSVYCQLIVWVSLGSRLKQLKLENINFDVYKTQLEDK